MTPRLFHFDLPTIFQCAVELGIAIGDKAEGAASPESENAGERLLRVLNPREVEFNSFEWKLFLAYRESGMTWPREPAPRPGWVQELELADVTLSSRQALLTLGLALTDLRGDPEWHERGHKLLSAAVWNLWSGMTLADRNAVRHLLKETHRLWGWPARGAREPGRFKGRKATLSEQRIISPAWRNSRAALDAINDAMRTEREFQLELTDNFYPSLPLKAPDGTPLPISEAYESLALALVQACYFRLRVLPVLDGNDLEAASELTRKALLKLPWGEMTVEDASRLVVQDCERAKAAYGKAETFLRAVVDTGGRCNFADALDWTGGIADICEAALNGQLPWDQAAAAIHAKPGVSPQRVLEEVRRQASLAAVGAQKTGFATSDKTRAKRRMTVKEANDEAMKLAQRLRSEFFLYSERKQAKVIGCHWKTWRKTDFYQTANAKRIVAKQRKPSSPKAVSLTAGLETVTGEGEKNEILQKLIAEQEADIEPSPVEHDITNRPRKVHSRKRL
jgi:hypothetical protein